MFAGVASYEISSNWLICSDRLKSEARHLSRDSRQAKPSVQLQTRLALFYS